ncbi:hypothetical protein [Paraflavitalea speifideaquila]|uniref:hypothetical protein n=1 Tax=Paraflavitalea speifideaquila TaxID=3076558 RepID=UPI0028E802CE|nr:hypothetical protein [Paraflavitalea speifideiaquila]
MHNYNFTDFKNAFEFLNLHAHKYPFAAIVENEFTLQEVNEAFAMPLPTGHCALASGSNKSKYLTSPSNSKNQSNPWRKELSSKFYLFAPWRKVGRSADWPVQRCRAAHLHQERGDTFPLPRKRKGVTS